MPLALAEVKRALGPEAVILHTRSLTTGGVLGYGGSPCVEITAAKDADSIPAEARRPARTAPPRPEAPCPGVSPPTTTLPDRVRPSHALDDIRTQVGHLQQSVGRLLQRPGPAPDPDLPQELRRAYQTMVEAQVSEQLAEQLVRRARTELGEHQLHDPQAVRAKLASFVQAMLPVDAPVPHHPAATPRIIALVGPTGVGKTTTVAKLAANEHLRNKRKVGLITVDVHRVGAVDQLRTYAEIIDVPLQVVATPAQMRAALRIAGDRDLLLIDTPGCSRNDAGRLRELAALLEAAGPHEVHLTLSGTCHSAVITQALERFRPLGANRILFTKLDEALGFGVILNCLSTAKLALSYVATGPTVPTDLQLGPTLRLAEMILDG